MDDLYKEILRSTKRVKALTKTLDAHNKSFKKELDEFEMAFQDAIYNGTSVMQVKLEEDKIVIKHVDLTSQYDKSTY